MDQVVMSSLEQASQIKQVEMLISQVDPPPVMLEAILLFWQEPAQLLQVVQ